MRAERVCECLIDHMGAKHTEPGRFSSLCFAKATVEVGFRFGRAMLACDVCAAWHVENNGGSIVRKVVKP